MCTLSNHPFIRLPGLRVSFSQRQTKIKNYNDSIKTLGKENPYSGIFYTVSNRIHIKNNSCAFFNQSVLFFFSSFLLNDCNLHHIDLHSQKQDSLSLFIFKTIFLPCYCVKFFEQSHINQLP